MLNIYEFDLFYVGNKFFITDLQGANLGNIESCYFNDLDNIISNLTIYHEDYIYRPIEECEEAGEEPDEWDLRVKNLIQNSDNLSTIDVEKFKEYLQVKNIDKNAFKKDLYVIEEKYSGSSHHLFNDGEMAVIYTNNGSYSIEAIGDIEVNLVANQDFENYKNGDLIDHFRGDGKQFGKWIDQYTGSFFDMDMFFNGVNNKYKMEFESQNWYEVFFDNLQGEQEYSISLDADNLYDAIDEVKELIKDMNKDCEI